MFLGLRKKDDEMVFWSREVGIEKISSKCVDMLLSHQISGHRCRGLEIIFRFILASGTSKCLISVLIELPMLLSFAKKPL